VIPDHFTDELIFGICLDIVEQYADDFDRGWITEEKFFKCISSSLAMYGWSVDKFLAHNAPA